MEIQAIGLKINQNIKEMSSLTNLQDTLIPKLISGEERVGEENL